MLKLLVNNSVLCVLGAIAIASMANGLVANDEPNKPSNKEHSFSRIMCSSGIEFYSACDAKRSNLVLVAKKKKGHTVLPIPSKYAAKIKAVKVPEGCKITLYTDSMRANYSASRKSLGLMLRGPELKCFSQIKTGHRGDVAGFLSIGIEDNVDMSIIAEEMYNLETSMEERVDSVQSSLGKQINELKKENSDLRNQLKSFAAGKVVKRESSGKQNKLVKNSEQLDK